MPARDTWGPFETRDEAAEPPAVREIHAARRSRRGPVTRERREEDAAMVAGLILGACEDAGVILGDYDHSIVEWLAGWEPEVAAVIAGLIRRAAAAKENPGA